MLAVAINRYEFRYVRTHVAAEDLQDNRAKELYVALEECFRGAEDSLDALVYRIQDESLKGLVIEKAAVAEFAEKGPEIIQDSVVGIRERSFKQKREHVNASMRKLEKENAGQDQIRPLIEEIMWIDAELQKLKDARE